MNTAIVALLLMLAQILPVAAEVSGRDMEDWMTCSHLSYTYAGEILQDRWNDDAGHHWKVYKVYKCAACEERHYVYDRDKHEAHTLPGRFYGDGGHSSTGVHCWLYIEPCCGHVVSVLKPCGGEPCKRMNPILD